MKATKPILLSALSITMLTGCSIFDKSEKYVVTGSQGKVSAEREVVVPEGAQNADGPVLTPPKEGATQKHAPSASSGKKAVKNKKNKDKGQGVSQNELAGARGNSDLTADSEPVGTENSTPAQAPDTGTLPADFTVNGEWTIYSVRGETVTGEERPYITFDLAANRFYGSNGCNIINGNIKLGEKGAMRLSEVISTMKMCQDAPFEYLINVALDDVRSYTPRQEGSITFLDLKGASGNVTMVLRRHNMDFLNGAWKVLTLNGTPLEQEDDATMTINIPDLKIHGTTGCNIFNGTLFIDPDKRRSMQFADIATTRMMCPPDSRETEFLLALESVESARQTGENIITMYDNEGAELFTMERIPMRPDQESAE